MSEPHSLQSLRQAQASGDTSRAVIPASPSTQISETASSATAAKVKALVQARYEMALYRPRDLDVVRQKMLKECQRPRFAEASTYSVPKGKKQVDGKWVQNYIEGPSIRFAEMAVRNMTNVVVETMTVYDDREKRIVNVSVTDLEGNVPYAQDVTINKAIEKRSTKEGDVVLRHRTNSEGKTVYLVEATDDEILNHQNALISKAMRTLALRLVPGDIVDECMDMAAKVINDEAAADPRAAKNRVLDSFSKIGITADQVKKFLGHNNEQLTPKELESLRGIYSAINDGHSTWAEVMDGRAEPKKGKPENDKEADTATASHPVQEATPTKTMEQTVDTDTGEITNAPKDKRPAPLTEAPPSDAYVAYRDAIREAQSVAELDGEVRQAVIKMKNEDERDLLLNLLETRIKALGSGTQPQTGTQARPRRNLE